MPLADCGRTRIVTAALIGCLCALAGARPAYPEVLPWPPHESQQHLAAARRAVEEERFAGAVLHLDVLLSREGEDGFAPAPGRDAPQRPLEAEALSLLLSLPPKGLALYEVRCGGKARQMLREAIDRRDRAGLARVAERYLATRAGGEAALLLAYDGLDRGRPWEALAWLRRLDRAGTGAREFEPMLTLAMAVGWLRVGQRGRTREVLRRIESLDPALTYRIGDEEFRGGEDPARALAVLDKMVVPTVPGPDTARASWPMFRGDPARSAVGTWSGSLGPLRWRVDTVDSESSREAIRSLEEQMRKSHRPLLPAVQPLLVGSLVLARTPGRLVAIDTATGRQAWEFPWGGSPGGDAPPGIGANNVVAWNLGSPASQRSYQDAAYGQVSSDGRRVFLLDGLDLAGGSRGPVLVMAPGMISRSAPTAHNRLVALAVRQEGKLAWSVGGAGGEDEPKLAGAFFLGPPLPIGDRLHVLAEINGEISLCTLAAATGRLQWSRLLAVPERAILQDPQRRLAAAAPSWAEGVLICPTSAGAVVAVDPATRAILWGRQYEVTANRSRAVRLRMIGGRAVPVVDGGRQSRSNDSAAVIAAGRVLLAPVESDELYCLDLLTGELAWKRACDDLLFVAGVHEDTVVVVGSGGLSAWSLATGKPVWRELAVELPDEAVPSGCGFLADGAYYLPTDALEIVKFDLAEGRILQRIPLKTRPGNLVGLGGLLISQSAGAVEAFAAPSVPQ